MDSKIVNVDRKAFEAAVKADAEKVIDRYIEEYFDGIDEKVAFLKKTKHEGGRAHITQHLRASSGYDVLDGLFSNCLLSRMDAGCASGIDAVLNTDTGVKASAGDLCIAVKKVKWEDLTDKGKDLLVDDLAKSYAENAADLFKERFKEDAEEDPEETIVDIYDSVLDAIAESSDHVPGIVIDEDHAFVLMHLVPKRKADDDLSNEAKRACP